MWNNVSLGSVFSSLLDAAQKQLAEAQESLAKIGAVKDAVQAKINEAAAEVNKYQAVIDDLEASGCYCITLSPEKGPWSGRLVSAANCPSTEPGMYSACIASLTVATDLSMATSAFGNIAAAMTEPVKIADMSPVPPVPAITSNKPVPELETDIWIGKSLGDLFPGAFKTAEAALNNAKKALKTVENVMAQLAKKEDQLHTAIADASAQINGLGNTGVYNLTLPPATGSWIDRMKSQPGAPADTANYYVTGFVVCAVAADLATVEQLFAKLKAAF